MTYNVREKLLLFYCHITITTYIHQRMKLTLHAHESWDAFHSSWCTVLAALIPKRLSLCACLMRETTSPCAKATSYHVISCKGHQMIKALYQESRGVTIRNLVTSPEPGVFDTHLRCAHNHLGHGGNTEPVPTHNLLLQIRHLPMSGDTHSNTFSDCPVAIWY
jgi:hypothetical protein